VSLPSRRLRLFRRLHSVQFSALSERGADADWTVKSAGGSVQIQCKFSAVTNSAALQHTTCYIVILRENKHLRAVSLSPVE
jgi:hypothetical protein